MALRSRVPVHNEFGGSGAANIPMPPVALTGYFGVSGTNLLTFDGTLFYDQWTRIGQISDGTSNTIMVGERPAAAPFVFGWRYAGASDWEDLQRIADFLRGQELSPQEPLCLHESTTPLYLELDRLPPLRYLFYGQATGVYRGHRGRMLEELSASQGRYAVSDLMMSGWRPPPTSNDSGPESQRLPSFSKPLSEVFPWSEPIVFRSGRYAVHRVRTPNRKFWK